MIKLLKYFIASLLLIIFFHLPASASIDVYDFNDEEKRADFISLTKELRCPKCQNQDIADSNAPIAADMRKEVHRLLTEGKSKDTIVEYMVDRFGDFVTYKPRKSAETFMLWYGPWVLLVVGIVVIAGVLRKNKLNIVKPSDSANDVKTLLAKYDADKKDN